MTLLSLGALILQNITVATQLRCCFQSIAAVPSVYFLFQAFWTRAGHANWEHYMNNFLLILLLGPMLEEKYGSKRIAFMIAVTAVVTGVINILLFPEQPFGASGVVFMLFC